MNTPTLGRTITYPSLEDRVVLITGGARGLGRVMALDLLAQGARLMLTAARSQGELDDTLKASDAIAPDRTRTMLADVSVWGHCQKVAAETKAAFGRIDVLINNAARSPFEPDAVPGVRPKFWEAEVEDYQRMVDTNFVGPFLMAKAVIPDMIAAGFGKIINISTSRSTMLVSGSGPYGACKAGLEAATVAWARDLEGTGITANVLLPGGPADTALLPGGGKGDLVDVSFKAGKGPLGLEGQGSGDGALPPEIMGPPTLWLCADDSNDYSGRRVVARDWDPDLPPEQAVAMAMQPRGGPPRVM